jgi:hypothetical protein
MVRSGQVFIGGRVRAGRVQRWGSGRHASFNAGRGGFGSVLVRSADGLRVLWACSGVLTRVGIVQRGRGNGEGVRLFFLLISFGSHGRGPGWSTGGSTAGERGSVCGYCYGARAYEGAIGYSSFHFIDFCPQGVRHNVRKKQSFEFKKKSTWVLSSNG